MRKAVPVTFTMNNKKRKLLPDFETEDEVVEVKTQTYYTTGTAGEKVFGVPNKYRKVSKLRKKAVKVACVGFVECLAEDEELLERSAGSEEEDVYMNNYHKSVNVAYIGATDIMRSVVFKVSPS